MLVGLRLQVTVVRSLLPRVLTIEHTSDFFVAKVTPTKGHVHFSCTSNRSRHPSDDTLSWSCSPRTSVSTPSDRVSSGSHQEHVNMQRTQTISSYSGWPSSRTTVCNLKSSHTALSELGPGFSGAKQLPQPRASSIWAVQHAPASTLPSPPGSSSSSQQHHSAQGRGVQWSHGR